ncbi:MAG: DUF1292 domain-containing protein [bacterium]|nr:DUF1292 domain-containing protein [bacterium]
MSENKKEQKNTFYDSYRLEELLQETEAEEEEDEDFLIIQLDEEEPKEEEISPDEMAESLKVTFTKPDGSEMECEVLGVFVAGETNYMAMYPLEAEDKSQVLLFPFEEGENGKVQFRDFEDEAEFQRAEQAFQEAFAEDF